MKKGILYRSAELDFISKDDIEAVGNLGIRTIVDLRTPEEKGPKTDERLNLSSIRTVSLPFYPGKEVPTGLFQLIRIARKKSDFTRITKNFYLRMATHHKKEIRMFFELLSDKSSLPLLLHCRGGKDRTGFLTALVHSALRVNRKEIYKDYLLTNGRMEVMIQKMRGKYRWLRFFGVKEDLFRPMLLADKEYLEFVLTSIERDYGKIDSFLTQGCGLDPGKLNQIRKNMTGPR